MNKHWPFSEIQMQADSGIRLHTAPRRKPPAEFFGSRGPRAKSAMLVAMDVFGQDK
jgi:hypothetical protein